MPWLPKPVSHRLMSKFQEVFRVSMSELSKLGFVQGNFSIFYHFHHQDIIFFGVNRLWFFLSNHPTLLSFSKQSRNKTIFLDDPQSSLWISIGCSLPVTSLHVFLPKTVVGGTPIRRWVVCWMPPLAPWPTVRCHPGGKWAVTKTIVICGVFGGLYYPVIF